MASATGSSSLECSVRPGPVGRPARAGGWLTVVSPVVLASFVVLASASPVLALGRESYAPPAAGPGRFPLVAGDAAAPLVASAEEYPGVLRALKNLQADIGRVIQVRP